MERVAFLIEPSGQRIGCLLNPDSLVVRRSAGLRQRQSSGGKLTGAGLSDDPLLYTGGGRTELLLDLLFDVQIGGSTIQATDVRDLTHPLWALAENAATQDAYAQPSLVRFVWGKAWNIPVVVAAIAERLEYFTSAGAPLRSWLRMRLLRVSDAEAQRREVPIERDLDPLLPEDGASVPEDQVSVHRVIGAEGQESQGEDQPGTEQEQQAPFSGQRLEDIAFRYYGDPSLWRVIASFNGIVDPAHIQPGRLLRLPPLSALAKRS